MTENLIFKNNFLLHKNLCDFFYNMKLGGVYRFCESNFFCSIRTLKIGRKTPSFNES